MKYDYKNLRYIQFIIKTQTKLYNGLSEFRIIIICPATKLNHTVIVLLSPILVFTLATAWCEENFKYVI